MAVAPGISVDLPTASPEFGGRSVATALMTSFSHDSKGADQVMVFFDDDRFFLSDASDCDMLRDRLRERVGGSPDKVTMLLMADKQIRHSDLVRFSGLAKEAGIERLSIAVKPE